MLGIPLEQFRSLSLDVRAVHLRAHGELVSDDFHVPCRFYSLFEFYVEVTFDVRQERIVGIMPFVDGAPYDHMVERIDLSSLGLAA